MIENLESVSKVNLIIEAASDLIKHFVTSMLKEPGDPGYDSVFASWAIRYPYINDLHIMTATKSGAADADHLEASEEFTDAFPAIAFFIDEVRPNPERMDECWIASLGCRIEVQGETFSIAQREIHEIHRCIRSIMHLDKSLGGITGRGGVVDVLKFSHFMNPEFLVDEKRKHIIAINYFYSVWFKEAVYR